MGFSPLGGVVVVADHTWAALKGKEALKLPGIMVQMLSYDTDKYLKDMTARAQKKGNIRREEGNISKALKIFQ